jgi:3-isopropylmalate/(R)-2-methylmalate dehydratase large subunit
MGGAFGAFATGVGSTEMLGILVTGQTWLRVPETIRVEWSGKLPPGVMAKDVSLKTIGETGHAGATYKAVEYVGDAIDDLPMDERFAITNMAVETGAKAGLMRCDGKTREYLAERGAPVNEDKVFESDADAAYSETFSFDAASLTPMASCPHEVDNVVGITDVEGTPIDQAYLGSCTGGRHDTRADLRRLRGPSFGSSRGGREVHLVEQPEFYRQDGQQGRGRLSRVAAVRGRRRDRGAYRGSPELRGRV